MRIDIDELFGPGGALSAVDPDYEHRAAQAEMAAAVYTALEKETGLVVEAGTGVGKSLGYLLPGAIWAAAHGERLLVSTHTRALQEQLMEKELPLAARVMKELGFPLRYAMLMGAENYLCVARLDRLAAQPDLIEGGDGKIIAELSSWSRSAGSAHRSGLPVLVPPAAWSRIRRDPDICLATGENCLYKKDRERAERAQILVVNHALLLSGAKLPSYGALVIDEAHNLEDAAVSRFGVTVSEGRFFRLLSDIGAERGLLARLPAAPKAKISQTRKRLAACEKGARKFFTALSKEHGLHEREDAAARRFIPGDYGGVAALGDLEESLRVLSEHCAGAEDAMEMKSLELRSAALRNDVAAVLEGRGEDTARWVERSGGQVELRAAPLEIGARLSESLLSRGIPVVMTSATLSSGHGLKEFKARVGFEGARELTLSSPFDYESQAALLVLEDLPAPQEEDSYVAAVAARCREIIASVPGGLFILFSSWKMLRRVHELLRGDTAGRPLWTQMASGNEALVEEFAAAGNAVLLGVDTFWQGVDVPGSALSCVVMVKLPFPNFTSPIEEARREFFESFGRNYFEDHSLPRAVMKFRQGFGRLIRSTSDRGAVVVLDSRVLSRRYGPAFLEALPRCRRLASIEDLRRFFESAGAKPGKAG